jgi:hypothetical protein
MEKNDGGEKSSQGIRTVVPTKHKEGGHWPRQRGAVVTTSASRTEDPGSNLAGA